MYAMMKADNKILINRLDDSERIILQNLVDSLSKSTISMTSIVGETGDFDGVMIETTPILPEKIEIYDEIATNIKLVAGQLTTYIFPVDENVDILIKHNDYNNLIVISERNRLTLRAFSVLQDKIQYEIRQTGKEPYYGEIEISADLRTTIELEVVSNPEFDTITLMDASDTIINPIDPNVPNRFEVGLGQYKAYITKAGYENETVTIDVENIDMLLDEKVVTVDLTPVI